MLASIRPTTDGGYIAAGMYAYDGDDSSSQWIVKLDAVGNVKWQKALGSKYVDLGILVTQTTDGGYALSGGIGADAETLLASIVKRTQTAASRGDGPWAVPIPASPGACGRPRMAGTYPESF